MRAFVRIIFRVLEKNTKTVHVQNEHFVDKRVKVDIRDSRPERVKIIDTKKKCSSIK